MHTAHKKIDSNTVFHFFIGVLCVLIFVCIVYPLYFVVIASLSNPTLVSGGKVVFWPLEPSLRGYQMILEHKDIWVGYRNTILYTAGGTLFNLAVTLPASYAVSRKEFMPRRLIMFLFVLTMYLSGGLIPTYLLISALGISNTAWVFIIPFALNVYNFIITRTFFETGIPEELRESALLDGCSEFRFFLSIALPLSRAIVSVIALYYAVAHWNDFFTGLIYIRSRHLIPLQLVLRELLLIADNSEIVSGGTGYAMMYVQAMKYGVIIISTAPLLILYPFIQKYFEKGIMLGAVKG